MTTAFQKTLEGIERRQDFFDKGDERTVRDYAIKPLLLNAGWNIFDPEEVNEEQVISNERVDLSLRMGGKSRIFIEAKRWKLGLTDENRDQLHRYCLAALKDEQMAANSDVPRLGILTNGRFWRFYVAPDKTNHKLRQMDPEIDIINADKTWVQNYFTDFLSRKNVTPGEPTKKTLTAARKRHRKFVESIAIRNKLIKAWNSLIRHPKEQEDLLSLFASSRKIQAEQGLIEDLIESTNILFNEVTFTSKKAKSQKPTAFSLGNGQQEPVKNWADLLRKLCTLLYQQHRDHFSQCFLSIGQAWISPVDEMKKGHEQIGDSDAAVSVHGNAGSLEYRCRKIVASLGYAKESLIINRSET